jgi:hypothetical protein
MKGIDKEWFLTIYIKSKNWLENIILFFILEITKLNIKYFSFNYDIIIYVYVYILLHIICKGDKVQRNLA